MKKLFIGFILLMALFVYAVPTESDVGAGYQIANGEGGGAIILSAQFEQLEAGSLCIESPSLSCEVILFMEEEGYLAKGLTYNAKYAIQSATPFEAKRSHYARLSPQSVNRQFT